MRVKLGIPMTLSEICEATAGELKCNNATVFYVSTDTRQLEEGDLFIALAGSRNSCEEFIPVAKGRGAFCLGKSNKADVRVLSSEGALLALASYYKERLPVLKHTVGITGSVGKTTTKEFLSVLVHGIFKTHKNEGNFNNHIGLPLTVLSAPADTELLILEMGMNGKGEISALSKCARPDIGIITNVGTAHIGRLGSREAIAAAKLELTDGLKGLLIVPAQEPLLSIKEAKKFAVNNRDADLCVSVSQSGGIDIYTADSEISSVPFFSYEKRHLSCLAPALLASFLLGAPKDHIKERISEISQQNTRQTEIRIGTLTVISDYYNASSESFEAAILSLRADGRFTKKSVLIGDMLELGDFFFDMHKRLGALAAECKLNNIFVFGDCCEAVHLGATENGFPADRIFLNPDAKHPEITAAQIKAACNPDELILFKASRGMHLELVVSALQNNSGKSNKI